MMTKLRAWFRLRYKQFACEHRMTVFYRNIYGDEIHASGGKRQWRTCLDCGKFILVESLSKEPERICQCGMVVGVGSMCPDCGGHNTFGYSKG